MSAADRVSILEDSIYASGKIIEELHEGNPNASEAASPLHARCVRRKLLLAHSGQQQIAEWGRQTEERRRHEHRRDILQVEVETALERLKREGENLALQKGGGRS